MASYTSCISTSSFYPKNQQQRNKLNGGNSASLSDLNNSYQSNSRDEKRSSSFNTPPRKNKHYYDRYSPYNRSPNKNRYDSTRFNQNSHLNSKKRKQGVPPSLSFSVFSENSLSRYQRNESKEMKKTRSSSEEDYRKQSNSLPSQNESTYENQKDLNRNPFNLNNSNNSEAAVVNSLLSHNNNGKVLYRNKPVTIDEVRNEDKENEIDNKHDDLLEANKSTNYLNPINKFNRLDANSEHSGLELYSSQQPNYYNNNYSLNYNYNQNRIMSSEDDNKFSSQQSTSSSNKIDCLYPVPLRNLGNTCYMNAIVQPLFNLPFLMCELRDSMERASLIKSQLNFSMTESLVELFEEYKRMRKTQSSNDEELERRLCAFKYNVGLQSAEFKSSGQHDAVEFLDSVINSIDDEFDKIKKIIPNCQNPISKVFKIELGEASHCEKCNLKSNIVKNKSHCLILSLPEEKYMEENSNSNLQQILKNYFKPEKRESKCEKCDNNERNRYLTVVRSPRVLILQLGRYSASGEKRHEPIKVPFEIFLPKVHTKGSKKKSPATPSTSKEDRQKIEDNVFELSGVICHHGSCVAGGHYICYIHDRLNNEWYHCDDENIMQTTFDRVQDGSKSSGYCFFYLNKKYI